MKLQQLLSYTRKAVDEYDMIQEGDHIAVGISGGKDSLTLLYALSHLRKFYPDKFDIVAVTVDLGFDNLNLEANGSCPNNNTGVVGFDILLICFHISSKGIIISQEQDVEP